MKPEKPRLLSSTRVSITIEWDGICAKASAGEGSRNLLEDKKVPVHFPGTVGNDPLTEEVWTGADFKTQNLFYFIQKKDRISNWITVYSGLKTRAEIKGLKPGYCFEFRLKIVSDGEESSWSESLFAATKDEAVSSSSFFRAIQNGHLTNAKKIIGSRPLILNIRNKLNQSPIEVAIFKNDVSMVNLLLNQGVDVRNAEIGSWRTPLMIAACMGHLEIMQFLLEKGCSLDDRDRNGLTALHYAADNSHLDIVKFATENGADVSAKDKFGWSPIMRAVILRASLSVVEYLLDHGGDKNDSDAKKQTLLMQAVLSGRADVVKLLISRKADINVKNIYGHTAYEMAKFSPDKDLQSVLPLLSDQTLQ